MLSQAEITGRLRDRVVGDLHLGRLHAGDRLPGVREVAEELDVGVRAVVRAYRTLEAEGLVEVRSRSGVYVAPQERLGGEVLEETAEWLARSVAEAVKRRISVSQLPEFIRRCTATVQPRCALLESTEDHLAILSVELQEEYGFDVRTMHFAELPAELPESLRTADLLVTTAFHARAGRVIANMVERPLVVLTVHPNIASALERQLRSGLLTVVCADAGFGERVQAIYGERYPDRIRVVLADDAEEVGRLDPEEPVLLTLAARRRLGDTELHSLLPHSPSISPESGRELAEILIRLNVIAERNGGSGG